VEGDFACGSTCTAGTGRSLVNTYRFQDVSADIDIWVLSIHSEKGEIHTATIILEKFRKSHFIHARPYARDHRVRVPQVRRERRRLEKPAGRFWRFQRHIQDE